MVTSDPFSIPGKGKGTRIASETQQQHIAMLKILLATCETALDAFRAADNPVDVGFVAELEQITERTREELTVLAIKRESN